MPATEIEVTAAGKVADKLLLIPTGQQGNTLAHVQDWVTARLKARKPVKDISQQVLVKGIKQWTVFEDKAGVRTVFKIT
jgi:hypothetical protein